MTQEEMEARLTAHFPGSTVAVLDLTGGGDHYEVRISAKELLGMPRILQHKRVMAVFSEELKTGEVHALSIKVLTL